MQLRGSKAGVRRLRWVAAACALAIAAALLLHLTAHDGRGEPALPQIPTAAGNTRAHFRLIREEGFTGSQLNRTLWTIGEPWEAGQDFSTGPSSTCPAAERGRLVSVDHGQLELHAEKSAAAPGKLESCFVTTRNHFSFTHGYLEARVRLPSGAGLWPAFWLLGNGTGAHGWPGTGEVDIFEFVNNGRQNGVPFVTVHYAGPCAAGHCLYQPTPAAPLAGYAGRWLTVGLLRTSTQLRVYIDGKPIATLRQGQRNSDGVALPALLFDSPMHVRFDLQAGGWANDPHHEPEPGTFAIQYLRAWDLAQ